MKHQLSKVLKNHRTSRKLTQIQVAGVLCIDLRTYQAYEQARAIPPLAVLVNLRDLYHLPTLDALIDAPAPPDGIEAAYRQAPTYIRNAVQMLLNGKC